MIWSEDCQSWYKNNSALAQVSALWPGSSLHYIEALKETRFDDWDVNKTHVSVSSVSNNRCRSSIRAMVSLGWAMAIHKQSLMIHVILATTSSSRMMVRIRVGNYGGKCLHTVVQNKWIIQQVCLPCKLYQKSRGWDALLIGTRMGRSLAD